MPSLLVSRKEKEKQVIKLAMEGKTTREIGRTVHIHRYLKIFHKATDGNNGSSVKFLLSMEE
jgi:hypothetical protein